MGIKRKFSIIILLSGILLLPLTMEAQKVKRVVIDAGHGGHDPGAVGKISKEKDITLAIALKAGKLIKDNLKDVEVIYTRKTDVFVELYRRAKIANEAKADLFISIHCNANTSTSPCGAETYVMGLHKSEANLAVAQLENASILLEDDYHVQYEGFDPKSPEGYIFFSMLQNAYLDQSLVLASNVQKHLKEKVNLFNRGVKQAGFWVLYKTTMPSILIETAFISNSIDERLLASEDGQQKISNCIYQAVKDYKHSVESVSRDYDDQTAEAVEPAFVETEANPGTLKEEKPDSAENESSPSALNDAMPVYKVQFYISKSKLKPGAPEFKGLKDVTWYQHQGMYKYTFGNERTAEDAQNLVKVLAAKGFRDSFVVAFLNGNRITIDEAKKLLKN
jgi:N-acetylmuramoyl-L-alanine amidase